MTDHSQAPPIDTVAPTDCPRKQGRRWGLLELVIVGLMILILVAGVRVVQLAHTAVTASPRSRQNLEKLAAAMHRCHDQELGLPAPAIYGKDGAPLLSWRVALLPYLGQEYLYKQFHLDEPWDSEHNRRLLSRIPAVYAPPVPGRTKESGFTYYQVFVGNGAAFEDGKRMRLPADFQDGASNTILIVEAAQPVPWTKPQDLRFDPDKPLSLVGGLFTDHFNLALADGTARSVHQGMTQMTMRCLITRSGGEIPSGDW
jgi:hypothetical protein